MCEAGDTFAPPQDAEDKDVARLTGYAEWLSTNSNRPARRDGAALTRVLNRLEAQERVVEAARAFVGATTGPSKTRIDSALSDLIQAVCAPALNALDNTTPGDTEDEQ